MDEDKKKELMLLSMRQWRAIHGAEASKRVYKDHRTGTWITWDDIANMRTTRILNDLKIKKRLKR